MSDPLRDALQTLLGPAFRLEREIGGGGMSRVFLASEPALKREVVVKVLPHDLFSRKSAQRFQQEVEVTARLQHPHILPVVTSGGSERLRYYVVPFIVGGSVRERLDAGERLPFAAALSIVRELLSAVAFAHEQGIVHRDIKPGNVLISEGHAVLADFGIAHAIEAARAEAGLANSSVAPPPAYLAPERPTDAMADLFAVSVLAFEMLTGRLPQAGASVTDIVEALRAAHRSVPAAHVRGVATVLARALAVGPSERFADAIALRHALEQATTASSSRSVRTVIGLGSGVLAAAAIAAFQFGRAAPPSDPPPVAQTAADSAHALLQLSIQRAWTSSVIQRDIATQAALDALQYGDRLAADERAVADGLVALGRRQYPEACEHFERARTTRESFAAWMGVGECRFRDSLVVPATDGTPVFRASFFTAAHAYREATRLARPNERAIAIGRMQAVLFVDPARVRRGFATDGRVLLGQPFASGDTIAFEAFPTGPRRRTPEGVALTARAVAHARELLKPAIVMWVRDDATNVRAREVLIDLLESSGNITVPTTDGLSALAQMDTARALDMDQDAALRLARTHVRLLLRNSDFRAAGRIADGLLRQHAVVSDLGADDLLALAMLTGQASRAVDLLTQTSGQPGRDLRFGDGTSVSIPASSQRLRAEFIVGASLGLCTAAVREGPARLRAVIDAMFPSGERPRGAESAFFERPLLLALPCLGVEAVQSLREPIHPLAAALHAPGDAATQRALGVLAGFERSRSAPGGVGFESTDGALIEANVRLLFADSAGAAIVLARALDGIALAPNVFLNNEQLAATLTRAMALRAELAYARGEIGEAKRWAAAATTLWTNADEALQPTVARLRAIEASSPTPSPDQR